MEQMSQDDNTLHSLKNHLTIIVGFSELLLQDLPAADPKRADITEIHVAAVRALKDTQVLAQRLAKMIDERDK